MAQPIAHLLGYDSVRERLFFREKSSRLEVCPNLRHDGATPSVALGHRQERTAQPVTDRNSRPRLAHIRPDAVFGSGGARDEIEHHEGVTRSRRNARETLKDRREVERLDCIVRGEEVGLEHGTYQAQVRVRVNPLSRDIRH